MGVSEGFDRVDEETLNKGSRGYCRIMGVKWDIRGVEALVSEETLNRGSSYGKVV